jgi:hypothetical protein
MHPAGLPRICFEFDSQRRHCDGSARRSEGVRKGSEGTLSDDVNDAIRVCRITLSASHKNAVASDETWR